MIPTSMRCLLLLLVCFSLTGRAQTTESSRGWQALTIEDGLSQGMIFDLKQDRQGFLWAATKDGLNRYDGHNFKVFTHDPYNAYSLSDNACSALLVDRRGRLWAGTMSNGLNLYDDRTQRFYHVTLRDKSAATAGNNEIQMLDEDPDGNIWVGTSDGSLFKLTLPATLQQGFPKQADFTGAIRKQGLAIPVQHTLRDHFHPNFNDDGECLTVLNNDIVAFNWRKPGPFRKSRLVDRGASDIFDLYDDPQQGFRFVSTDRQIKAWHRGVVRSIALPGRTDAGAHIRRIDGHTLAISTPTHLWRLSAAQLFATDSLRVRDAFVSFPPDTYGFPVLLLDRTGTLWVGTNGYGIRKFNPYVNQFHSFLPHTTLSSLLVDQQGRVYVRHQFAYGLLDRTANKVVPFLAGNLPEADQRQRFIMQDRRAFFWVSNAHFQTHAQHLFKFSSQWKLLKKYPLPAGVEFGFWGNQTLEDTAGQLWIGAANGRLLRFDPETETFRVFNYRHLLSRNGADIETFALHFDQAGTLWIGTSGGLVRADHPLTKPTFTAYVNSPTDRQSLSNDVVSSIVDDPREPNRYLWVSTKGGGLERLDKASLNAGPGKFMHITEAQGLPNNVVYGILVDPFNHFWMSTNRGLAQFDPRTLTFRNFTKADGLQDNEFNTGSFAKTASGELLFGGINGLTAFRPAEVAGTRVAQPVRIVELKVNNQVVRVGGPDGILTESIDHTKHLDLTHTQNGLAFEFEVMDFVNPPKNRYRYFLEGIDRGWVEAGTNRFANYAQLPDGNYTLHVMGSANGQTWSRPVALQIRVHPPFYRTWWAYLFYLILLMVIVWQLYTFQNQRWRLQQQVAFEQKEAARLAELDDLKTRFFTNISHEFRTPLTLILGPLSDLEQQLQTEKTVSLSGPLVTSMARNSKRLLTLINQLLDLNKLEAGQLRANPQPGDLAEFLRILSSSFSSLAQSRRIAFLFTQQPSRFMACFDRDKIEKIVTNLLSNAFKFTPAGQQVHIRVDYQPAKTDGLLTITVQDTGIGIATAHLSAIFERFYQQPAHAVHDRDNRTLEGTGIGLSLVRELVHVLGGTIAVASTQGVGTTFTVELPLTVIDPGFIDKAAGAQEALPDPAAAAVPVPTGPLPALENILLVIDDNSDVRAYVRAIFEDDYHVMEAEDGQEGLKKAMASLPNIVICDLMMPRLDGFNFCWILKTQETTSHIPIVMLTARATVEDRIDGLERGADDYLTKPFNRAELRVRVRNLVQQRARLYQQFATRSAAAHNPAPAADTAEPAKPGLLVAEQKFLDRLSAVVIQHLDDPDFSVEALAEAVNMSRTQLFRKLKAVAGKTATNFILDIRMEKASQLLNQQEESVTQVAYAVGFDNPSYFTKVFKERYGVLPSQYSKPTTYSADPG